MRQNYVLGFVFDRGTVLLIRKNKPEWQRDLWNGIGGKVDDEEASIVALSREFHEETGLQILPGVWAPRCCLSSPQSLVVVYTAQFGTTNACSTTAEAVGRFSLGELPTPVVPNLRWLVPLLLDDTIDWSDMLVIQEKNIPDRAVKKPSNHTVQTAHTVQTVPPVAGPPKQCAAVRKVLRRRVTRTVGRESDR